MRKFIFTAVTLGIAAGSGCHGGLINEAQERGEVTLQPTQGSSVQGKVSFKAVGPKFRVMAEVAGLLPGAYGFYIHELGDCTAPDAGSVGPLFNPDGKLLGKPAQPEQGAGGLPHLIADARGNASLTVYIQGVELGDGERGLFGRSVIVSEVPGDAKTRAGGVSGKALACGVIVGK